MAIPFTSLYGARPSVLPQSGDAFGQLTRGLMNGFSAGRTRAQEDFSARRAQTQEDEAPDLIMEGLEAFDNAALGQLMDGDPREGALTDADKDRILRMLANPLTEKAAYAELRRRPV